MDKLKPILVHKFWIVAGLALLVPLIGWWMDTGSLSAQIETRKKEVDTAFQGTKVGPDAPNDKWEAELKKINSIQDKQLRESTIALWEMQKGLMVWPSDLADLLVDVPYRGEISNTARDLYRTRYKLEMYDTIKMVRPYDKTRSEGVVVIDPKALDGVPEDRWQFLPPTTPEMWDAQEDFWLWRALLAAINGVNGEATSINEAYIREIYKIELLGGTLKAAASGGGEAAPAGDAAAGGAAPGQVANPFMVGGGGGKSGPSDYDPKEDFGSQQAAAAGGDAGGAPAGEAGAAGGTGNAPKMIRYVDEDPNLPYKRRGFHIKVLMDHRKVPDLIVQLCNLKYPVTILRVHQVARFDDMGGARGGAAAAGGAGNAGFGGGPMDMGIGAEAPGGNPDDKRAQVESAKRVFDAAMSDPYLATVSIAGIMTLYQPPKDLGAPAPESPPDGATPPAGAAPGQPQPVPAADPAATPGAPPAEATPGTTPPAATTPSAEPKPADPAPAAEPPKTDTEKPATPEPPKPADPKSEGTNPPPAASNSRPETSP